MPLPYDLRAPTPVTINDPTRSAVQRADLNAASRKLILDSLAPNTARAVVSDLRVYLRSGGTLPATVIEIANFLATQFDTHGKKAATIQRYANSLHTWHCFHHVDSPVKSNEVRRVLQGLKKNSEPSKGAPAMKLQHLETLIRTQSAGNLRALRNQTLFSLAFFGAFRRSELVKLRVEDIEFVAQGVCISLRSSKTNRGDREEVKPIVALTSYPHLCPVTLLRRYMAQSATRRGAIFRAISAKGRQGAGAMEADSLYRLLREALNDCGLNQYGYTPHSFRAGFITEAHRQGKDHVSIKRVSGHRDQKTFERYIREVDAFRDPAGALNL